MSSMHSSVSPYAANLRMQNPSGQQRVGVLEGTRSRTLLIAVLLCLWEGLPFTLIDVSNLLGLQVFSLVIFAGAGLFVIRTMKRGFKLGHWEKYSLLLFALCVLVSFIYSNFIQPQPLAAWAFAIYTVAPTLTLLALRAAGCTLGDAIAALFWTGFIGAIVLIINQTFSLDLLHFYERGSAFGTNRVVFFKLESAFCLVIAAIRLLYARGSKEFLLYLLAVSATFYSTFFLTESRLAMLAVVLALVLSWIFVLRGKRKVILFLIAPFILIPVTGFVINKYLADFRSLDSYLTEDTSASWRQITIRHFEHYFSETNGLGFGFMSANPAYDNVIADSSNYASQDYGVVGYVVSLDDIGIYSALFQYGYAGLALIVVMTLMMVTSLYKARSMGPAYWTVASIGVLAGAFMLSPISMNYFTLFYTAHIGGMLWFMAAESSALRRSSVEDNAHKGRVV